MERTRTRSRRIRITCAAFALMVSAGGGALAQQVVASHAPTPAVTLIDRRGDAPAETPPACPSSGPVARIVTLSVPLTGDHCSHRVVLD